MPGRAVPRTRARVFGPASFAGTPVTANEADPSAAAESLLSLASAPGASGLADAAATVAVLIAAASAAGVADARAVVAALAQSVAAVDVADARSTSVLLPTTAPGTHGLGEVETVALLLASSGAAGISDAAAALILLAAAGSSGIADARDASLELVPTGSGDEEETVTVSFTFVATGTAVVSSLAPAPGGGWVPATHWPTRRARVEPAPPADPHAEAVATIRLATSSRSGVAAAAFSRVALRAEGAHLVEWTPELVDVDDDAVLSYLLAMVA